MQHAVTTMNQPQTHGFSLIEALVSILVLAIGFLGMASIQTRTLSLNHDSYLRSTALAQLQHIADRMRANKLALKQGNYNQYPSPNIPKITQQQTCHNCSPTQLAKIDLSNWALHNQQLLPNGQGHITGDGQFFTITVLYDRDRTGATGTDCSGNSQLDLTCLTLRVEL